MMSKELRNLNISDLEKMIAEKRNEISDYTKKLVKGSEKNLKKVGVLKKELARMLTVLNEFRIIKEAGELKNE